MSYSEYGRALRNNNVRFIEEIAEEKTISGTKDDAFNPSCFTNALFFTLEQAGADIDVRIIECLLTRFPFSLFEKRDFNLNQRDEETQQTALCVAAAKGNYHVCKLLLEYGASVHSLGRRTPISSDHILYPADPDKNHTNLPPVSVLANTASLLYDAAKTNNREQNTASLRFDADKTNNQEKIKAYFRVCNLLIDWGADIAIWKDFSREDPMASYKEAPSVFHRVLEVDCLLVLLSARGGRKYLPRDFLARATNIDNPTEKQIDASLERFESLYLGTCRDCFADKKHEADKPKRIIPASTLRSCADLPFSEMCHEDCYRFLNRVALAESNKLIQPLLRKILTGVLKGTKPPSEGEIVETSDLHLSHFIHSSGEQPGQEQKLAKEKGLLPHQYKSGISHPSRRVFSFMDKEKYPLEFDEQEHDRIIRRLKAHLENYFPGQVGDDLGELTSALGAHQTEKAIFTAFYHGKISTIDKPPKVEEEQAKQAGNYPKFPLPFLMCDREEIAAAEITSSTTTAASDDKDSSSGAGADDDVTALKMRIEELTKENELLKKENEQGKIERELLMKQLYSGFK